MRAIQQGREVGAAAGQVIAPAILLACPVSLLAGRISLLACSASLLACGGGEESKPEDTRTAADEGCALPDDGYDGACNGCLAVTCCTPIAACKSDATCAAQLRCEVQCQYEINPQACFDGCFRETPPHPDYTAYDDCSFRQCRSTCWM